MLPGFNSASAVSTSSWVTIRSASKSPGNPTLQRGEDFQPGAAGGDAQPEARLPQLRQAGPGFLAAVQGFLPVDEARFGPVENGAAVNRFVNGFAQVPLLKQVPAILPQIRPAAEKGIAVPGFRSTNRLAPQQAQARMSVKIVHDEIDVVGGRDPVISRK